MTWVGPAVLIARKDLRLEYRTRDIVTSVGLFALLVVVTASFALPTWGAGREGVAAGVLWMAFLFASLLGVGRSFAIEREESCIEALMLSPAPRESIFLGKLAGNLAFTWSVELVILPLFIVLLQLQIAGGTALLLAAALLGTLGLVTIGTLFAAIAVNTKTREAILPLLVLPVAIPLMIAAVKTTEAALGGTGAGSPAQWIALMTGFDVLFLLVGLLTFPFLTET